MNDKMRSVDERFRSLEEKIDLRHEELVGMMARLFQETRVGSKGQDELGRGVGVGCLKMTNKQAIKEAVSSSRREESRPASQH